MVDTRESFLRPSCCRDVPGDVGRELLCDGDEVLAADVAITRSGDGQPSLRAHLPAIPGVGTIYVRVEAVVEDGHKGRLFVLLFVLFVLIVLSLSEQQAVGIDSGGRR